MSTAAPPPSRAESVKEELIRRIVSGDLRPGDRLPAERTLAAELGVSRNVLREAIGSLSAINLLETQPGAGVFVAALDIASLLEPIQLVLSLGQSNLRSLIQARRVIEPGVAELAARSAGPEEIGELLELLRRSREVIDDAETFLDLDVEIHDAIVRITRNPILMRISDAIRRLSRAARELGNPDPILRRGAMAGHQEIVEAIASRDPAAAAAAMHAHLEFVEGHIFALAATRVGEHQTSSG